MPRLTVLSLLAVLPVTIPAQSLVVTLKSSHQMGVYAAADGRQLGLHSTGIAPHEVTVSDDGRWAVATDYGAQGMGGNTLTLVDLRSGQVERTIELPYHRPHGARFLADNRTVVVTAERDGKVVLVDVVTGAVTGEASTGQRVSHMVSLSPDGRIAYTANIADGSLSIVPLHGDAPVIVPVGTQTEAINIAPDGRTVWMGSNNTGKVFVVDLAAARVVDTVQTNGFPYRIDFTPDNRIAIVTNAMADEIRLIDAATREVLKVVPTGAASQPMGIAMAPDGSRAWITMGRSDEVAELSLPDGRITRRFSTGAGSGPDGIAYVRGER
ncbi:MAG TPA: cytochrome D1 domain-containing protein [Gemmatimonadales bacterium]|nr:cytochrome D1 domain-containing protein [Gemmatimonadales bacterium]